MAAAEEVGIHGVRANANLQIDYQHGFDDIAQFAQYGFIVGFSACVPAHAHGVHTGGLGGPRQAIAS